MGCSFWHLCEDMIEAYSWTDAFLTFCNTPRPEQDTVLEQNRECESRKYAFHEEKLDRKLEEKQLCRLDKICNTI